MIKQLPAWTLIHKSLQQNLPVMLLYVLESHGSSPGRPGFLMAINSLGEIEGSIGGGIMEHKFVELVKDTLQSPQTMPDRSLRTQYHDKRAAHNQSGMICSGDQTILLHRIQPGDGAAVEAIVTCLATSRNGTLTMGPAGIQFVADQLPEVDFLFHRQAGDDWLYQEKLGYKNQLYIVGGGHCARALSDLMSRMDFYIRVFDDRPDVHTLLLNETAHEKIIVNDYTELAHRIPAGNHHYVVVMTVGYRTDDLALRALMDKAFAYLGVLGSRTKINKLMADYRSEAIEEEKLGRIHSPIGVAIHSQTPEEIAVSIAAEIIGVKNRPNLDVFG